LRGLDAADANPSNPVFISEGISSWSITERENSVLRQPATGGFVCFAACYFNA
jgi:hypothetical protein